jgi:hypothetical protein
VKRDKEPMVAKELQTDLKPVYESVFGSPGQKVAEIPIAATDLCRHVEQQAQPILAAPLETQNSLPALLSARDLAEPLGQPVSRVESALRRYRQICPDCCVYSNNPRRNEPKYLYRTDEVMPILRRSATDD